MMGSRLLPVVIVAVIFSCTEVQAQPNSDLFIEGKEMPEFVTLFSTKTKEQYLININDNSCLTPCQLKLRPGQAAMTVSGANGSITKSITLPSSPSVVTIQPLTIGHLVSGIVLSAAGLTATSIGSFYLANRYYVYYNGFGGAYIQQSHTNVIVGSVLVATGGAATIAGITNLALIRRNKIEIKTMQQNRFSLLGGGLFITNDRAGAEATLLFKF